VRNKIQIALLVDPVTKAPECKIIIVSLTIIKNLETKIVNIVVLKRVSLFDLPQAGTMNLQNPLGVAKVVEKIIRRKVIKICSKSNKLKKD